MSYSLKLQRLALRGSRDMTLPQWSSVCHPALNGEPGRTLRQLVPIAARRRAGAFFTSFQLARRLLKKTQFPSRRPFIIIDPACGAGDLLLSAARRLPLGSNLHETIAHWSRVLHGCD